MTTCPPLVGKQPAAQSYPFEKPEETVWLPTFRCPILGSSRGLGTEAAAGWRPQAKRLRSPGAVSLNSLSASFHLDFGKVFPNMGAPLFDWSSVASS
jgi:hypothetical protein